MTTIKRPWQATTLGILNYIGFTVLLLLAIACFILNQYFGSILKDILLQAPNEATRTITTKALSEAPWLTNLPTYLGIILLILALLSFFIARGVFHGKQWSPILTIVFGIMSMVGMITSANPIATNQIVVNFMITIFIIYCAIICIKHPFCRNIKQA